MFKYSDQNPKIYSRIQHAQKMKTNECKRTRRTQKIKKLNLSKFKKFEAANALVIETISDYFLLAN